MNFIEIWFSVSPDGGDGTFEVTFVAVTLVVATTLLLFRHRFMALFRIRDRSLRASLTRVRSPAGSYRRENCRA
jgi:hypothetical protein